MKKTTNGKIILSRDEAVAFASFLMNERKRHLKDIAHIDRSLQTISQVSSISICYPFIVYNDGSYAIDGVKLDVPWIDEESISVEENNM